MKININLISSCRNIEINGLIPAKNYISNKLKKLGHEVFFSINYNDDTAINIVIGAHLDPQYCMTQCDQTQTIIFNTEQLHSDCRWATQTYLEMLSRYICIDYSPSNMNFIRHKNKFLLEFSYCKEFNKNLYYNINNKDYDILFYGLLNERRSGIIDSLISRGIKVKYLFGVYGHKLDEYLSRSRAVLNIHYYNTYYLQPIRFFYPITNNIPVISENYVKDSSLPIYDQILFTPDNLSLVDYICEALSTNHLENNFPEMFIKYKNHRNNSNIEKAIKLLTPINKIHNKL